MTADIIYLETCLPDYHFGHPNHTYAVDPYGTTGDVRDRLLEAIEGEELYTPDGAAAPVHYEQVRDAAVAMFDGLDLERTWDALLEPPADDTAPLAYFGVLWR